MIRTRYQCHLILLHFLIHHLLLIYLESVDFSFYIYGTSVSCLISGIFYNFFFFFFFGSLYHAFFHVQEILKYSVGAIALYPQVIAYDCLNILTGDARQGPISKAKGKKNKKRRFSNIQLCSRRYFTMVYIYNHANNTCTCKKKIYISVNC